MRSSENLDGSRQRDEFVSALHHRLKNNLQTITSVIGVQASQITDPNVAVAVRAIQNRVRAIAGVFGTDSTDDLSTVHFGDYLKALVRELTGEYRIDERVNVHVSVADLALDMDQAIPLALIANELIANALEHAFPSDGPGEINVHLSYRGPDAAHPDALEEAVLEISDTGVPLPAGWNSTEPQTTGFSLVRMLTVQLGAKLSVDERRPGKTFRLTFSLGA